MRSSAFKLIRHLFHLAAGSVPPLLGLLLPRRAVLWFLGLVAALFVVADATRLLVPSVNRRLISLFRPAGEAFKSGEAMQPIGSTYLVVASFLAYRFFPPPIATASLFFGSVGDALAAIVGERYGRTRIGKRSLEGSAAFLASSLAVGSLLAVAGLPLKRATLLIGALVATLAELAPIPVNDNFTVPLLSASAMLWAAGAESVKQRPDASLKRPGRVERPQAGK